MRRLLPLLFIALLAVLCFQVYLGSGPAEGTFVLESKEVGTGGTLTGLLALGRQGNIRPAEQLIPTELRVLKVGESVRAVAILETEGEKELGIEYYILDMEAEKVRSGWAEVVVDGRKEVFLELERPPAPGEYIFHVTVRDKAGISTDIDVFRVP